MRPQALSSPLGNTFLLSFIFSKIPGQWPFNYTNKGLTEIPDVRKTLCQAFCWPLSSGLPRSIRRGDKAQAFALHLA